jgi:hypothetical protein
MVDPKTGLALYGPYDSEDPSRPLRIRLGLIGTGPMIELGCRWIERCQGKVNPISRVRYEGRLVPEPMDPTVFPIFPGLGPTFGAEFVLAEPMIQTLTAHDIASLENIPLFEPRVTRLVELLMDRLRVLADRPAKPDVVIIALSTEVRKLCTIASHHRTRAAQPMTLGQRLKRDLAADAARGQANLFDVAAAHSVDVENVPEDEEHSVLHHGLKARAMELDLTTQLVWQEALEGSPRVENDATRAWNFWTGVYYKAGGIPWRVSGLEQGTCFVGVSFYRDRGDRAFRTCMAQAFSDQGEGLVLRSEPFKWEDLRSPHLTNALAQALMERVLHAYDQHWHQPPSRVVVHKWQRYWSEEREGFEAAIIPLTKRYDLVAFGSRGLRFFRTGNEPPLRGTMVPLSSTNALLYTRGYIPYLGEYPGMRVPRPVEIVEHFGSAPMSQLCREVLALTKMDWNSAAFAGKDPITTAFAEDVADILAQIPSHMTPKPYYRFYM